MIRSVEHARKAQTLERLTHVIRVTWIVLHHENGAGGPFDWAHFECLLFHNPLRAAYAEHSRTAHVSENAASHLMSRVTGNGVWSFPDIFYPFSIVVTVRRFLKSFGEKFSDVSHTSRMFGREGREVEGLRLLA